MPPRTRILAAFAAFGVALGACQSTPPALTDPKEILTRSIAAVQGAKSVHVEAKLDGTISLPAGASTSPGITLSGTSLSGDVDIAGSRAHLAFQVPALLGLSGDLVEIGTTAYLKTSLGGPLYTKTNLGAAAASFAPSGLPSAIPSFDAVGPVASFLTRPGVNPTKRADVACGSATCYEVAIDLTPTEIAALAGPAPSLPIDVSSTSISITIDVDKASLRPASVAVAVNAGATGSLTLTTALTNWDASVSIAAPPADQIGDSGGGGLPFPIPSF